MIAGLDERGGPGGSCGDFAIALHRHAISGQMQPIEQRGQSNVLRDFARFPVEKDIHKAGSGSGGFWGMNGRFDLTATDASDNEAMLLFQTTLQFLVTEVGRIQQVLAGTLTSVNDGAAQIYGSVNGSLPGFRLNVINHTVLLDVGVEPHHHSMFPQLQDPRWGKLMLMTPSPASKKKLDTARTRPV